jgi:hypothetical protein
MSHLGDLLSAHIDGELDGAERDKVSVHLARCERCRAEAAGLRALKRQIGDLATTKVPGEAPRSTGPPDPAEFSDWASRRPEFPNRANWPGRVAAAEAKQAPPVCGSRCDVHRDEPRHRRVLGRRQRLGSSRAEDRAPVRAVQRRTSDQFRRVSDRRTGLSDGSRPDYGGKQGEPDRTATVRPACCTRRESRIAAADASCL